VSTRLSSGGGTDEREGCACAARACTCPLPLVLRRGAAGGGLRGGSEVEVELEVEGLESNISSDGFAWRAASCSEERAAREARGGLSSAVTGRAAASCADVAAATLLEALAGSEGDCCSLPARGKVEGGCHARKGMARRVRSVVRAQKKKGARGEMVGVGSRVRSPSGSSSVVSDAKTDPV